LQGTNHRGLAEAFIDFMLSRLFQEDIPLNMFVFPANEAAVLPEVFVQWADIPDQPATVDPAVIDANREACLKPGPKSFCDSPICRPGKTAGTGQGKGS
jgi:thiamine transport system substrate-binding protein